MKIREALTSRQESGGVGATRRMKGGGADVEHPSPPTWASVTLLFVVVGSTWGMLQLADRLPRVKSGDDSSPRQYIVAAVPFFFVMMVAEYFLMTASKFASQGAQFDLVDSWASIGSGIIQQLFDVVVKKPLGLGIVPYSIVHASFPSCHLPDSTMVFVVGFIFMDLGYYWVHRFAHEVRLLWAGHKVHHEGEHYNLSTALRQSWIQSATSWIWYLPIAPFFSLNVHIVTAQLNLFYQYWVHTCMIRRLGPLELVLMTPSHHRVHHDRRVHKNFGGVFIIWDRLFGSFVDEYDAIPDPVQSKVTSTKPGRTDEACLFGTMRPPQSYAGMLLQVDVLRTIYMSGRSSGSWLKAMLQGPGHSVTGTPRQIVAARDDHPLRLRSTSAMRLSGRLYIIAHFALVIQLSVLLMGSKLKWVVTLLLSSWIVFTLYCHGRILDRSKVRRCLEYLRVLPDFARQWAVELECLRCGLSIPLMMMGSTYLGMYSTAVRVTALLYGLSTVLVPQLFQSKLKNN